MATDLFGDIQAHYTGRLLRAPEVRTKVIDQEGHAVPVLCLDIESDSPLRLPIHVEQPYPLDHHAQCQAAARRLSKGMHITVEAPMVGVRLVVGNATHIHTSQPSPQEAS
jgi:hypothetical protein